MTRNTDFVARAHSLWRVRMARFQERLRFFWQLLLACTGCGALLWSQFTLPGYAWTVALQCLGGKGLDLIGSLGNRDIKMNVGLGDYHRTVSAHFVASDPLFTDALQAVVVALLLGAAMGSRSAFWSSG